MAQPEVRAWIKILVIGILIYRSKKKCSGCTSGFTLFEILVVLLIISIIVGSMTFSFDPKKGKLKLEARRFAALAELAAEEAVLKSEELGLFFTPTGYLFVKFHKRKWQSYESSGSFRERILPQGIAQKISVDGEEINSPKDMEASDLTPQIVFLSNGEFPPFQVIFMRTREETLPVTILADPLSGISIKIHHPEG